MLYQNHMDKKFKGKTNLQIISSYLDGTRPFIQVGYIKKEPKRSKGETWVDGKGVTWRQENGFKTRVNKQADSIRALISNRCKKCDCDMKWGGRLDKLFFNKTGLCENCLITHETNLRILNIYGDYEKYKLVSNELGCVKDAREKVKDAIRFFTENTGDIQMLCNSEGFLERWQTNDRELILKGAKNDLKIANKKIKELEKYKKQFKDSYVKSAKKYNITPYGE